VLLNTKNIPPGDCRIISAGHGRFLCVEIKCESASVTILGLYSPNSGKWAMTQDIDIDYNLFSDLYWMLVIGKCETGESWMYNNGNCPLCGKTQTSEHLLWTCTSTRTCWSQARTTWNKIDPEVDLDFPKTWAHLILSGDKFTKGDNRSNHLYRRWRIILSEGLWTLWTARCEWSFQEADAITESLCRKRLRQRVALRVMTDLRRAVNEDTLDAITHFQTVWNVSNMDEPIEWL
jgi:hypothetical protein